MFHLRSVGVLSSAKIFAVVQGAIGIILGFFLLIFAVIGAAFLPAQQNLGMFGMIVVAVLMPVLHAAIGFVMGAIWAWVYNLAAQWIGGLELQLDAVPAPSYVPQAPYTPPSPAGA